MNNRSFSLCVKTPFFPMRSFLTCLSVMLPISPLSPLCSLDPPVHSICSFFPCGLDASTCVPICFQLRVSCRSYCTVMGQVTHLEAPGRDVTLAQPPPSPPSPLWSRVARDLSLAFSPPETTKPLQNQNIEERSVFHLGAEPRLRMLRLKGFSALHCNTAFINYQLIQD